MNDSHDRVIPEETSGGENGRFVRGVWVTEPEPVEPTPEGTVPEPVENALDPEPVPVHREVPKYSRFSSYNYPSEPSDEPVSSREPKQPVEKVPFMACLRHETKKAYTKGFQWLSRAIVYLCYAIDVIAAIGAIYLIAPWYYSIIIPKYTFVLRLIELSIDWVIGAVLSVVAIALSLPLWAYPIIIVGVSPFMYALFVCIARRFDLTWDEIESKLDSLWSLAIIFIGIPVVSGMVACLVTESYKQAFLTTILVECILLIIYAFIRDGT